MHHNPYQPPSPAYHTRDPYRPAVIPTYTPARGSMLVWARAALSVLAVLGFPAGFVFFIASDGNEAIAAIGGLTLAIAYLSMLVSMIVSVAWVYMMWDSLPEELRANYKRVHSPLSSALYLLIPYFNLYWMFVVTGDLLRAINSGAQRMNTRQVPEAWAIWNPIMQIFPGLNIFVAPITWSVMMFQAQAAKDELVAAIAAQTTYDPRHYIPQY